jgi:hypothetical protein
MSEQTRAVTGTPIPETFFRATIRGRVVKKIRLAKSLIFVVVSNNALAKKADFPRFVANRNLDELEKTFNVGDRVTVEAYLRTSRQAPGGLLVPTSVKVEKSRIDAAFAREPYLPDDNIIAIRGKLVSDPYIPNKTTTLATFEIATPTGKAFARTIAFGGAATALSKKHKGEVVDMLAYVRTKSLEEAKERDHTQSLVITSVR